VRSEPKPTTWAVVAERRRGATVSREVATLIIQGGCMVGPTGGVGGGRAPGERRRGPRGRGGTANAQR